MDLIKIALRLYRVKLLACDSDLTIWSHSLMFYRLHLEYPVEACVLDTNILGILNLLLQFVNKSSTLCVGLS